MGNQSDGPPDRALHSDQHNRVPDGVTPTTPASVPDAGRDTTAMHSETASSPRPDRTEEARDAE